MFIETAPATRPAETGEGELLAQATRDVAYVMRTVYPDARDRLHDIEACVYATDMARRHAESDRFGPEHALTMAYRAIADEHAARAARHTRDRLIESIGS
jgi:hypothetical protein